MFIVGVDGIYKDSNAAPGYTQPSLIVVMMTNNWPDIQRHYWRHDTLEEDSKVFQTVEKFSRQAGYSPGNLDIFQVD